MAKTTLHIGSRILALLLLLISGYELWVVVDRWVAAIKYRIHFGADSGPYISLGLDTVLTGFVSLLVVSILSLWTSRKSRRNNDALSKWISEAAFGLAVLAIVALFVLVILPVSVFRR
jgi:hypothetical protein